MKNSTMQMSDTTSNRSDIKRVSMKSWLKIIVTSALLLAASSTFAGIVFLTTSGMYTAPGLVPVNIQNLGDETFRISTNGLTAELTIEGSDFPPGYDIATTAKGVLPFEQALELVVDIAEGTVSGRSTINFTDAFSAYYLTATAEVRGSASCLPLNGLDCGQLVVDLELRGALSDPNDPASVGQLRMQMLSSLVVDGSDWVIWEAMSANTTIGGNEALIHSLFGMVGDANLDG